MSSRGALNDSARHRPPAPRLASSRRRFGTSVNAPLASSRPEPFVRLAPPNCAAASAPAFATNGTAGGGEPAGEGRLTELLACVPCLAGTRALPASAVDGGAAGGRGDVCQLCPAGWLTTEPGASTCLACPAGTFSSEPGATSWRACRLCPSGSYSPEAGAASCLPCGAAEACPAGSSHPLDPLSLPSHPTGTAPAPSNATWFVGSVSSDFFPQAARRAPSTDQSLARAQLVITTLGGLSFFSFVVVLGLTALYRPRMAELMLRRADVPPAPARTLAGQSIGVAERGVRGRERGEGDLGGRRFPSPQGADALV